MTPRPRLRPDLHLRDIHPADIHVEPQPLRNALTAASMVLKAFTLRYVAESVIDPHQPKYRGKAMRTRAVGYIGGLALIPVAWWVRGRRERYPAAADLAVTMPLLIDAAGNAHGIYDEARLDDIVHLINTVSLASLFGYVISDHTDSRWEAAGATVAFGVIGGIGWEVMEYTAEALGFDGLGLSPEDTIADVTFGAIGALIAGAITAARWEPRDRLSVGTDG